MKFWQLISIFRDDPASLENTLRIPQWKRYLDWMHRSDELVDTQNREVLDAILPEELCERVMQGSKLSFCIHDGWLTLCSDGGTAGSRLSALDVYKTFGADAIEDVLEYGSWHAD